MKLFLGFWYLFLLARSLAGSIGACFAMALLSKMAFPSTIIAFFPVGRALSGTMFPSASFAVVLVFCASITGDLGLFAEGLLLLSELLCVLSFPQVVVPSDLFYFAYMRLSLFLSSGSVENMASICIFL